MKRQKQRSGLAFWREKCHAASMSQFVRFFWVQFLGALNDNIFKNALVLMITYRTIQIGGMGAAELVALAGGIFILPFFLFSPLAGQLADKWPKDRIIKITKFSEVLIMSTVALGFFLQDFKLLLGILFLMGTQSAFFGPAKYSVLPEMLPGEKLLRGNAFVEAGTFVAILLGTIMGGILVSQTGAEAWVFVAVISVSIIGWLLSLSLPRLHSKDPNLVIDKFFYRSFIEAFALLKEHHRVKLSILGISWFWFFGAAILSLLPVYGKEFLFVKEEVVTLFLAMFTLGIGLGSFCCERLSRGAIRGKYVIVGAVGMSLALWDLSSTSSQVLSQNQELKSIGVFLTEAGSYRQLFDLALMTFFGGFFTVPLYTLLQVASPQECRSRFVAISNIVSSLFMVIAAVFIIFLHSLKMNWWQIYLILGLLNTVFMGYLFLIDRKEKYLLKS